MGTGSMPLPGSATLAPGLDTTRRPPLPPGPYLVVGLGRAGMSAARALAAVSDAADVRVWDGASDAAQAQRARQLRRIGIGVWLGGDGHMSLAGARTVIKSPGVPWDIPVIAEAARLRLPVIDELEVGWRLVPVPTVAVTGTNGKSTVSALCASMLEGSGLRSVVCGNTEFGPPLSELALSDQPRAVVAEVSSYQAESCPDLTADGAVFTNLGNDHLNRHSTVEAYGAAKAKLFAHGDRVVPVAALNVDDALGRELASQVAGRGGRAITYGSGAEAEYRVTGCRWGLREARVELATPGGGLSLMTRLPGAHNAANAAAVVALSDGLGLSRDRTVDAIAETPNVPGRFEVVEVERPFDVIVDYAYSPGAVAAVLAAAREIVAHRGGRLITVLGVVGRAGALSGRQVGAAARRASDHVVISGTSYRGEPRLVTLAQLAAGARAAPGGTLELVLDRRRAIGRGLAAARPRDLVAILGRGPTAREATDWHGGSYPLDDRQVARELA